MRRIIFIKKGFFKIGSDLRFTLNSEKFAGDIKLFTNYEKNLNIRPFIGFEKVQYSDSQGPDKIKFIFGIVLYKWFL